jgi:putative iron-dependent peroxidase
MATPQPAIFAPMGEHQWYVHLSRTDGADLGAIKAVLRNLRQECSAKGINLVLGFGPTLLADLTDDIPDDFQPFQTITSADGSGREAKATQEELLFWMTSPHKDVNWKTQWDARQALKQNMTVARETITFIYGASLDMTGFIDGTGNPTPEREREVAIVPSGQKGAGGSFINAQRWVHDLEAWEKLSVEEQQGIFGRTKPDSERLDKQPAHSHLSHVELREGPTADDSKPKRDEIVRRSTPYALHTGDVGLYFMAFCKAQAPFRERLRAMYAADGGVRDRLVDYTNPASGSFYFAPSVEVLDASLK